MYLSSKKLSLAARPLAKASAAIALPELSRSFASSSSLTISNRHSKTFHRNLNLKAGGSSNASSSSRCDQDFSRRYSLNKSVLENSGFQKIKDFLSPPPHRMNIMNPMDVHNDNLKMFAEVSSLEGVNKVENLGFQGIWLSSTEILMRMDSEKEMTPTDKLISSIHKIAEQCSVPVMLSIDDNDILTKENVFQVMRSILSTSIVSGICLSDPLTSLRSTAIDHQMIIDSIKACSPSQFLVTSQIGDLNWLNPAVRFKQASNRLQSYLDSGADAVSFECSQRNSGTVIDFLQRYQNPAPIFVGPLPNTKLVSDLKHLGVAGIVWKEADVDNFKSSNKKLSPLSAVANHQQHALASNLNIPLPVLNNIQKFVDSHKISFQL